MVECGIVANQKGVADILYGPAVSTMRSFSRQQLCDGWGWDLPQDRE